MQREQIIVIDDHGLFRSGLKLILQNSLSQTDVHEADSLEAALAIGISTPDLVLLDVEQANHNSLDQLDHIKRFWNNCAIVIVAGGADEAARNNAMKTGAFDFVFKSDGPSALIRAVEGALLRNRNDHSPKKLNLSERQLEVAEFLRQGFSNKAIATRLSLSEFTVRGHVQAIFRSLNVNSRSAAVFAAINAGLLR